MITSEGMEIINLEARFWSRNNSEHDIDMLTVNSQN